MAEVRRGEHGAAAVEFALVVPVLCVLLFGIISYGMMLSFRQGLSQAAAEGARAAAIAPRNPADPSLAPAAKAAAAIADALGDGYACTSGELTKGSTHVGTCAIAPSGACTASVPGGGACRYRVTVTYDYRSHPMVPNLPLVPVPDTLTYVSSAQGSS